MVDFFGRFLRVPVDDSLYLSFLVTILRYYSFYVFFWGQMVTCERLAVSEIILCSIFCGRLNLHFVSVRICSFIFMVLRGEWAWISEQLLSHCYVLPSGSIAACDYLEVYRFKLPYV